jgi:hypothetical protein
MNKQNEKIYALADVVLKMVVKENGTLKLHARAAEGFTLAVDALFAQTALDPKEEIEAVIRLGWLFQRDQAIEVADGIIELVARDDRALSLLGISSATTREAKQKFAKMVSGKREKMAAPVFGKAAPAGSMKLSSFLEPGGDLKRRAMTTRR